MHRFDSNDKLPMLYKKSQIGKTQTWEIWVSNNSYTVWYGQADGKKQSKITHCKGKNIGKANETTDHYQAKLEALALWTKQQERKGYTLSAESVPEFRPMLARDYRKVPKQVPWKTETIWGSRKLNGLRCTWVNGALQSRGGVTYPIEHIINALKPYDLVLDGEIYCHGMYLNRINSAAKKPNDDSHRLKFVVFDVFLPDMPYEERMEILKSLKIESDCIEVLLSEPVTKETMVALHDSYVQEGYEGLMLRVGSGVYQPNTRSKYLFKYKNFLDDEFEIVGVKSDKEGQAVLECITNVGFKFDCRCTGTNEYREWQLANPDELIGKLLNVKFQSYTEYGAPEFNTGIYVLEKGEK